MISTTTRPDGNMASDVRAGIANRFIQIAVVMVLQAAILFGVSGQIGWLWAWTFLAISTISILINGVVLLSRNPEMVAERGNTRLIKGWDRIVATLYSLSLFVCVPLVAGLDVRFGWTGGFSSVWNMSGAAALCCALALAGWAMMANAFFSTAVRIQSDRGQTVCSEGPYRFVRHPGYVGFIVQCLATPILLGSIWALVPGAIAALALIMRTSFEDRTLQSELPGYPEYSRQVRYRLLPWVW
jgi:protein-S-isoprenylcysteine O-methyltransferase Ste14